jgi:hypothetical protein
MRRLVAGPAKPAPDRGEAPLRPGAAGSLREAERARAERAVLDHVLTLHPDHLPVPALVQDMVAGCIGFGGGGELELAIAALSARGLLRVRRGLVVPTPRALDADAAETLAGSAG